MKHTNLCFSIFIMLKHESLDIIMSLSLVTAEVWTSRVQLEALFDYQTLSYTTRCCPTFQRRSFANSASARQSFSFLFGSTRTKRWLRQLQGTAEPERDKRTKTNRAEEEEGGREDDDEEEGEKVVRDQGDPVPHNHLLPNTGERKPGHLVIFAHGSRARCQIHCQTRICSHSEVIVFERPDTRSKHLNLL